VKNTSILNDVLGPVMRGPSSSHTAGSYHLGRMARSLLGDLPTEAEITFDPHGSYAKVHREQGSDLAFAAGLLGWSIIDERFPHALDLAPAEALALRFLVGPVPEDDHPNTVRIRLTGRDGRRLGLVGRSIGGGAVEIISLQGWPLLLTGSTYEAVVETEPAAEPEVRQVLLSDGQAITEPICHPHDDRMLLSVGRRSPLGEEARQALQSAPGVQNLWEAEPLMLVKCGRPLLGSAAEMIHLADRRGLSAGQLGLLYEAELLGLPESAVIEETVRRFHIMSAAVARGLQPELPRMQLLRPSAGCVFRAEAEGKVALGGTHTRAAARALAAMHVNCGMGVVCAAPTAGSAGVLPAVLVTLREERGLDEKAIARALLAAGIVGVIVARQATFAAEVAGCQVEVGAAGAMAAAAVVEAAGGNARQAADAAAVCFQNTMGSVCDLVQGIVEIPCHTRNAVAAASAFVVADLILGGYENPIPLDETIAAVYAVGKMLPAELRVTALGGLAATPSARAIERLR
jgi:L-serine dehydratase